MFTDNCSKPLSGGASAGQTRHSRNYAFSIPFIATSRYPAATRLHLYLSLIHISIRYIGGVEQWKENFVTNIRKKAEAITTENMLDYRCQTRLYLSMKNDVFRAMAF